MYPLAGHWAHSPSANESLAVGVGEESEESAGVLFVSPGASDGAGKIKLCCDGPYTLLVGLFFCEPCGRNFGISKNDARNAAVGRGVRFAKNGVGCDAALIFGDVGEGHDAGDISVATVYPGATDTAMMTSQNAGDELGWARRPLGDVITDPMAVDAALAPGLEALELAVRDHRSI